MSEGRKDDQEKNRLELLPPRALERIGEVFTFGAKKYDDRNWELGIKYSRVFGALLRHLWAWWRGEGLDPESGMSHLAHAGCCLLMLLEFEALKYDDLDDRPSERKTDESTDDSDDDSGVRTGDGVDSSSRHEHEKHCKCCGHISVNSDGVCVLCGHDKNTCVVCNPVM